METTLCQSCGMPLTNPDLLGTNPDRSLNPEYCSYCFTNGQYTCDCTMDEMINHCAKYVDEFNKNSPIQYTKEDAIESMRLFFPRLKRWIKP